MSGFFSSSCRAALIGLTLALSLSPAPARSAPDAAAGPSVGPLVTDGPVLEARDAARKRDRSRLAAAKAAAQAVNSPLLPWVEYWDLSSRLADAQADEVEAFYARWRGTYVEDRLRNDWLLELGRRRDWAGIARDYPRFKMNDDREVSCWYLLTEHLAGRDVRDAARAAWFAEREPDDGCTMLATAMVDSKRFSADDVWAKARLAVETGRPAGAKVAVGLLGGAAARLIDQAIDKPARFLQRSFMPTHAARELRALALARLAATDPAEAAARIDRSALPAALAAWAWATAGRQAAFRLSGDAVGYYERAWSLAKSEPDWTDETLAWNVRASLRAATSAQRWHEVLRAIDAMTPTEQREPAWTYWKARALLATARSGDAGEAQRLEARRLLAAIASPVHYYGQLAAEELGAPLPLPQSPPPLTAAEREGARDTPGLARALQLVTLGLRDEARREWNFTLRGMNDRELLAAAQLACDRADWQLCINTAERAKQAVDVALRYPTPYALEITAAATQAGLEPSFVFGLIRQETRFMPQLRSSAGASGLMQVMPATARWVAKKVGLDLGGSDAVHDPLLNLRLGTSYLKLVLDDLGGSLALAAAAYNAGPNRPRRWRDGPVLDPAIWTENVPFAETRDYVKKVLSNASVYAALLAGTDTARLKPRLGPPIGPRDAGAPAPNNELP
jgi:soluble lytic murein transglycosylase